MSNQPDVSTPRKEVVAMQELAAVCRALLGGTDGMRKEGTKYLPKWPLEEDGDWKARVACTALFPAFEDAIDSMVGKPLGEPLVFENVPAIVEACLEDVDLTGRDFDTFSRDWMKDGLAHGITWAVVDYPVVPSGATLAQEREMKARPYVVPVPLANVVSWKIGPRGEVLEFRYRECAEVEDGEWGTKTEERIRVLRPGLVLVYREVTNKKNEWQLVPELSGPVSMREVAVACFAPGHIGHFTAKPPLSNLAWLNVQHWQSGSDQRNILHKARVPLLYGCGFTEGQNLAVGPNSAILGPQGSTLAYVEHTGAAIEAGRNDLLDLKEEMRTVAGKVMTRQAGGDKSATESNNEMRDGGSKLRSWCWTFQDSLENILRLMALWVGEKQGGSVVLNMDWEDLTDPAMFTTVLQARTSGEISQETFLYNAQRFNVLAPGRTVEDEQAALEAEGPKILGANPMDLPRKAKPEPATP